MAPEFQTTGMATQKTDVYAFGVVILELISGDEALKYSVDGGSGGFRRVSVIETAKAAAAAAEEAEGFVSGGGGGEDGENGG